MSNNGYAILKSIVDRILKARDFALKIHIQVGIGITAVSNFNVVKQAFC